MKMIFQNRRLKLVRVTALLNRVFNIFNILAGVNMFKHTIQQSVETNIYTIRLNA